MGCLILWFGFVLAQLLATVAMGQIYHVSGKVTGGPENVSILLYYLRGGYPCINMMKVCTDPLCKKKVDQVRTKLPNGTVSSKDNYQTYEFWKNGIRRVNSYVLQFRSELGKLGKTMSVLVFYSNRKECNDKKDCVINMEWQNNAQIRPTLESCAKSSRF